MKQKHHIVPRYEGGSDDPSNLVELTVTEHAMWHFAEWQRKRRKEDFIAWKSLSSTIEEAERVRLLSGLGGSKSKGRTHPEEVRKKISENRKGKNTGKREPRSQGVKDKISATKKGKKWYVNEKGEASTFTSHPGEGWVPGMKLVTGKTRC